MIDRRIAELAVGETHLAWPAVAELRPHLADEDAFVRLVDEVQRLQGYRLVGAFVDHEERAVAVCGFRDVDHLSWGAAVYVDDLVTLPGHRGGGHAGALLDHVERDATGRGRTAVHLDSGHGRHDAHRVYLRHHFRMTSHHFAKPLDHEHGGPHR